MSLFPSQPSRRALLAGGAGVLAAPLVATGGADAAPGSLPARRATEFVESVGLGVHLSYTDTPYVDGARVLAALRDLGVRHVRDDLRLDRPDQWATLNLLAGSGISADLITGLPVEAPVTSYVETAATRLASVGSLEGSNEWDLSGSATWPQEVYARQAQLLAAARNQPRTAGVPVLAPAMGFLTSLPALAAVGPLAAVSDLANAHGYSGGLPVTDLLRRVRSSLHTYAPGQPKVLTEAGYHNALNGLAGHPAVPERVAGAYVPRLLLQSCRAGISRTYLYELLDEFDDPGLTHLEAHFGLLRRDFTPKPAYTALRTLMRLAEDDPTPFRPRRLRCRVQGPSDVRSLVLQKRNGTHLLALWRDESLFDVTTDRRVRVRPAVVRVRLPGRKPVRVYRLLSGRKPRLDTRTDTVEVPLAGDPVVVAIGGDRRGDLLRPFRS